MKLALNRNTQVRGIGLPCKLDKIAAVCATIVFASLFSGSAWATDWRKISSNNDGSIFYVDQDSIKADTSDGNIFKFWAKEDAKQNPQEKFRTRISLTVIDCENYMIGDRAWILYDAQKKIIGNIDLRNEVYRFNNIIPGTIGEATAKFVCQGWR